MNDDSGDRISKLMPYKSSKVQSRSYIKDGDLQIQVPQAKESVQTESAEAFKNIYAHYSNQVNPSQAGHKASEVASNVQEVKEEMKEANLTYNMMMDISNTIAKAYEDLKNLQ